jgi:DNA-binding transcriptional LysR family regulator
MDKLQSMRAFAKVVQRGSFAAAARELRLSRSAVSKHVIDLEQDLGAQLLVRTTRSASPTEYGQAYYERATAILADLEEADLAVTRLQAEPRGILRVNAPMSVRDVAPWPRHRGFHGAVHGAAHSADPERSADRSGSGRF